MPAPPALFPRPTVRFRLWRFGGLLALTAAGAVLRADPPPVAEISPPLAAQLAALRAQIDGKDYPAALALTGRLLAGAPPDSYDRFVLTETRAQIFLNQGDPASAGPTLESALQQGTSGRFIAPAGRLELLRLLAQTHYQQAMSAATTSAGRTDGLDRALDCYRQWQAGAGPATTDTALLGASILYQRAVAGGGTTPPDRTRLQSAVAEADRGLALTVKLTENLLGLKAAALQQLGETAAAADQLELLVALQPGNPGYWRQLSSVYLNAAAAATDAREIRRLNHRALLTFTRARAHGLLTEPRSTFTLACLYFNLRQYPAAADLLGALRPTHEVPAAELERLGQALAALPR